MGMRTGTRSRSAGGLPSFWSESSNNAGGTVLTYAVRGGPWQIAIIVLGVASLAGGVWLALTLLSGGLTIAGVVFLLLVPGGLIAFGAHCLDIAWLARSEYTFTRHGLTMARRSIWGGKSRTIARADVIGVTQQYSPPEKSRGIPATWVTFVDLRPGAAGERQVPFDGMNTPEEARWLGSRVASWADVPIGRGFSASYEEADPRELPELDEGDSRGPIG